MREKRSCLRAVLFIWMSVCLPVNVNTFLINWSFKCYSFSPSDDLVGSDSKYVLSLSSPIAHHCYLPNPNHYFMWTAEISLTVLPAFTLVFLPGFLFFRDGSENAHSCLMQLNEPSSHFCTIQTPDMDLQGSNWSGPCLTHSSMTSSCITLSLHSLSCCYTAVFLLKRKKPSRSLLIHCLYIGLAKMSFETFQNILWKNPNEYFRQPKFSFLLIWVLCSPTPLPGLHVTDCILSFGCLLQYCLFMEKFLHEISIQWKWSFSTSLELEQHGQRC